MFLLVNYLKMKITFIIVQYFSEKIEEFETHPRQPNFIEKFQQESDRNLPEDKDQRR